MIGRFSLPRRLALEIIASHADSLAPLADPVGVLGANVTSTGMAVMMVGAEGDRPRAVIKVAMTPAAAALLARETTILARLHAEPRLDGWRELLPHPYGRGAVQGRAYRIDSVLPGWPSLSRVSSELDYEPLARAVDAIGVLHSSTARVIQADREVLERWVDVHKRELAKHRAPRDTVTRRLERLRDELCEALSGRRFSASWIHGDYWLGNVLFSGHGAATALRGIVDWETAAALELPLHDLLHLVLSTRRLRSGRELGHVICDQLQRPEWSAQERLLLERHGGWGQERELSQRHSLVLYWLRHAAMHMRQQTRPMQWRCRWWQHRNLLPVLGLL
jgi:aminoglycoside phosphotransferase (APT) family kinase protein